MLSFLTLPAESLETGSEHLVQVAGSEPEVQPLCNDVVYPLTQHIQLTPVAPTHAWVGYERSRTGLARDEPLLFENLVGPHNSVGINDQFASQVSNGRELLTNRQLTLGYGAGDLRYDLLVDRLVRSR